ncbi:MAG: hemerythrin domain-containing protein [Thermodesulfobacteriota bacterium]
MAAIDSSSRASSWTRRGVLACGAASALGLAAPGARAAEGEPTTAGEDEDWVSPPEDLMREHGVLDRLLLIYEACAARQPAGESSGDVLAGAAGLVRRFIEDYHEKLEEEHVFPRFEKAGKLVDLVVVLREQHRQGRRLTGDVTRLAHARSDADRQGLTGAIAAFVRMYRPHAAREDTVLFPAFRDVVGANEFHELGERFEDEEHHLFGRAGFTGVVEEVAALERKLGIEDLKQFTPSGQR